MKPITNPFTDADLEKRKKKLINQTKTGAVKSLTDARTKRGIPLTPAARVTDEQIKGQATAIANRPAALAKQADTAAMNQRREGLRAAPIGSTVRRTIGDGGPSAMQLRKMGIESDYSPNGTGRSVQPISRVRRVGQDIGDGGVPLTPDDILPIAQATDKLRATDGQSQTFQKKVDALPAGEQQAFVQKQSNRSALYRQKQDDRTAARREVLDRRQNRLADEAAQKPLTRQQQVSQYRETLRQRGSGGGGGSRDLNGDGQISDYERQKQELDLDTRRAKLEQLRDPTPKTGATGGGYWEKAADDGRKRYLTGLQNLAAGGGDQDNPVTTDTLGQIRPGVVAAIRALPPEQQQQHFSDLAMGVKMVMDQRPEMAQQLMPVYNGFIEHMHGAQAGGAGGVPASPVSNPAAPAPAQTSPMGLQSDPTTGASYVGQPITRPQAGVAPYPGAPMQSAGAQQPQRMQPPPTSIPATQPQPVPPNPQQRVVGQRYQAPNGQVATWNGSGWQMEQ